LQLALHPWTSYVVVPVFALANAGIPLNSDVLSRAASSPVTIGILVAYVVGKPAGILASTWLITTLRPGERRLPAGWAVLAGEDVRFVFRHLPLTDVHQHAQQAAEASEAAAAQGAFWEMHDLLLGHQDALEPKDLVGYAEQLGLDVPRFTDELRRRVHAPRVAEDVADADASQVTGTPTFFVDGRRHHGAYDVATLEAAVRAARQRNLAKQGVVARTRTRR